MGRGPWSVNNFFVQSQPYESFKSFRSAGQCDSSLQMQHFKAAGAWPILTFFDRDTLEFFQPVQMAEKQGNQNDNRKYKQSLMSAGSDSHPSALPKKTVDTSCPLH